MDHLTALLWLHRPSRYAHIDTFFSITLPATEWRQRLTARRQSAVPKLPRVVSREAAAAVFKTIAGAGQRGHVPLRASIFLPHHFLPTYFACDFSGQPVVAASNDLGALGNSPLAAFMTGFYPRAAEALEDSRLLALG